MLVTFFTNAQVGTSDRLKTNQQRQTLEGKSILNPIKFRSIGPSVMSGRVVDLDANPADPTEFYVAYASGGLWHTVNNGQSFTSIFDSTDILTIGDIAVNWKTRIIWVGTGEVNSSRSSYAGIGLYKSKDNGKSWQYLGLPETHHIGKIQLHPSDDNTAWVAALGHLYSPNRERGIFKTTDGGTSWKQTLFIDDNTGAIDVDINPSNPSELYASAWYRTRRAWNFEESGETSGIYKSTDGGNTWTNISKQGSGFPVGKGVGRIGIAVYPKNPQIVYAIVDNNFHKTAETKKDTGVYVLRDFEKLSKEQFLQLDPKRLDSFLRRNRMFPRYNAKMILERVSNGTLQSTAIWDYLYDANTALFDTPIIGAEVYRSDNGGQSWKKTNTKDLALYNTYGYYFGKIFVSPYNDQKLVITGFDIELSTDGGKTFTRIDKENVHADHHVAWFNPQRDDHFIIGNDGGANITYDNGKNWFKANTPSVGQFYSVFVDNAMPYNVYGGLQDNGVWYGPSNNRENTGWHDGGNYAYKSLLGGDGMQVGVDTRDNNTTYTGFQFGNYFRMNRSNPRDGFKRITPQHNLGEKPYRFNWQSPLLISKHNQDVIYFAGNKLFRSFNKADTFHTISPDLTKGGRAGDIPYGTITTISESPTRFGLLYVGTDDGNIQVSKDAGATWTLVNETPTKKGQTSVLAPNLWVSRLIASKFKEGRVYATLNGYRNDDFNSYAYVSEDYGSTWIKIGKDLPAEPVNVIKEDPKNEDIIYVGTDGGLYVSFDRGQSFM
ncbi:MAG: WD40/YVTN/BNR-like repeat-containing protein, partial [Flavisolibacter sp.]